jgi:hypothetical protein
MQHFIRRSLLSFCAALSLGVLCACEGNPVKDAAQFAGIGGEPKPSPDFVTRTRSGSYDYMPVGESAPKRPLKPKDVAGVAAAEKDLDGVKARNEALGNTTRQAGSAVVPAEPVPKPALD